jgi:hypothetical protein
MCAFERVKAAFFNASVSGYKNAVFTHSKAHILTREKYIFWSKATIKCRFSEKRVFLSILPAWYEEKT